MAVKPLLDRIVEAADAEQDCWLWTRSLSADGYGRIHANGRDRLAHQVTYELLVGPVPVGLELDHLCRVRHCVNPDHLEPVTNRENQMRGQTIAAKHARKTQCVNGHPFDEANTYWFQGRRCCRACNRRNARLSKQRRRTGGAR